MENENEFFDCDQDGEVMHMEMTQMARHETVNPLRPPPPPTRLQSRWFEIPSTPMSPGKRCGHMSMVHRRELYVFGGYNVDATHEDGEREAEDLTEVYYDLTGLWKWNNDTLQWTKVKTTPWDCFNCRGISGGSVVVHDSHAIVWGGFHGLVAGASDAVWLAWQSHRNACHILDLSGDPRWLRTFVNTERATKNNSDDDADDQRQHQDDTMTVFIDGTSPSARDKHTTAMFEGGMILFGGWGPRPSEDAPDAIHFQAARGVVDDAIDDNGDNVADEHNMGWFNNVSVLDLTQLRSQNRITWRHVKTKGGAPAGRASHTFTVVGSQAFVFGGRTTVGRQRDMHQLDLKTMTWREIVFHEHDVSVPEARSWHTATLIDDHQIFIFGGLSSAENGGRVLFDAWLFDTRQEIWTQVHTPSHPTIPRYWHTAARVGAECLIFGGDWSRNRLSADNEVVNVTSHALIRFQPSVPQLTEICLATLSCAHTTHLETSAISQGLKRIAHHRMLVKETPIGLY